MHRRKALTKSLFLLCLLSACNGGSDPGVDLLADLESADLSGPTPHSIVPASVDDRGRTVVLEPGNSIGVYWEIPQDGTLKLRYGFQAAGSSGDSAAKFRVVVETDRDGSHEVHSNSLRRQRFFSPEATASISLADYAGQPARIRFEVSAVPGQPAPQHAYWKAGIVGRSKALAPSTPQATAAAAERPNVIIYLIDALRADRLQPYGYSKPTSPRLQEFAEHGVVFENAYAQASWTRPAVATILTGLYPSSHITKRRRDVLPSSLPTIAGLLRAHGHHAYGFITQPNVGTQFGFGRDFDSYQIVSLKDGERLGALHLQSDRLFDFISRSFEVGLSMPAFLYVHAVDTHDPYTPASRFVRAPGGCDPARREMFFPGKYPLTDYDQAQIDCIGAIYDGAVRQSDYYFGLFLDLLKKFNAYDNALIIATADHGESFLEHGKWGHGKSLYQTEIRVPFIVRFPGNRHAGTRVQSVARHVDILPTITDLLGIRPTPDVQGVSLLPLLGSAASDDPPVFSELDLDRVRSRSILHRGYKLIQTGPSGKTRDEFYDLARDPGEQHNLESRGSVHMGFMKKLLIEWARAQKERGASVEKPAAAAPDQETQELLRALGYVK